MRNLFFSDTLVICIKSINKNYTQIDKFLIKFIILMYILRDKIKINPIKGPKEDKDIWIIYQYHCPKQM